jgi:hypothetical protein
MTANPKPTKLIQRKGPSKYQWTLLFFTLGTKAEAETVSHKYYELPRVEIRLMSVRKKIRA